MPEYLTAWAADTEAYFIEQALENINPTKLAFHPVKQLGGTAACAEEWAHYWQVQLEERITP